MLRKRAESSLTASVIPANYVLHLTAVELHKLFKSLVSRWTYFIRQTSLALTVNEMSKSMKEIRANFAVGPL